MNIKDVSLPEIYLSSADFRFFRDWIDTALTKTQYDIENTLDLYDPLRCPADLLWMLADTMGFKFDDRLPVAFNRLVLIYFMSMIRNKGSKDGVTLAAETNLAQFRVLQEAKGYTDKDGVVHPPKDILYNRLENTSIPVNSVYVEPHVDEGYIDVVYFSVDKPVDACIEYVRPLGMYCFQHAGVRFDSRTKISIDARLTDSNDIGMSIGATHVGHYSREDYARLQKGTAVSDTDTVYAYVDLSDSSRVNINRYVYNSKCLFVVRIKNAPYKATNVWGHTKITKDYTFANSVGNPVVELYDSDRAGDMKVVEYSPSSDYLYFRCDKYIDNETQTVDIEGFRASLKGVNMIYPCKVSERNTIDEGHNRRNVWYRNSEYEGTKADAPVQAPDNSINPGYRALYSLQLCNNDHIVQSLLQKPIFGLGMQPGPTQKAVSYGDDYELPEFTSNVFKQEGPISSVQGVTVKYDAMSKDFILNGTVLSEGNIVISYYVLPIASGDYVSMLVTHKSGYAQLASGPKPTTYSYSLFNQLDGGSDQRITRGDTTASTFPNRVHWTQKMYDRPDNEKTYVILQLWRVGTVFNNYRIHMEIGETPYNLRYAEDRDDTIDVQVIDNSRRPSTNIDYRVPVPAVNPPMFALGDAISLNNENTRYTNATVLNNEDTQITTPSYIPFKSLQATTSDPGGRFKITDILSDVYEFSADITRYPDDDVVNSRVNITVRFADGQSRIYNEYFNDDINDGQTRHRTITVDTNPLTATGAPLKEVAFAMFEYSTKTGDRHAEATNIKFIKIS